MVIQVASGVELFVPLLLPAAATPRNPQDWTVEGAELLTTQTISP
jgi:hypothetical protein